MVPRDLLVPIPGTKEVFFLWIKDHSTIIIVSTPFTKNLFPGYLLSSLNDRLFILNEEEKSNEL